jgi:hypothetical protein
VSQYLPRPSTARLRLTRLRGQDRSAIEPPASKSLRESAIALEARLPRCVLLVPSCLRESSKNLNRPSPGLSRPGLSFNGLEGHQCTGAPASHSSQPSPLRPDPTLGRVHSRPELHGLHRSTLEPCFLNSSRPPWPTTERRRASGRGPQPCPIAFAPSCALRPSSLEHRRAASRSPRSSPSHSIQLALCRAP